MISDSDLKVEYMRGSGPGGQHRNKTESACRITHLPTGTTAYCDERSQKQSYRSARQEIELRIQELANQRKAEERKARRDEAIKPSATVRTYNYSRGTVKDHRTGKVASIKDVVEKGKIDLLK